MNDPQAREPAEPAPGREIAAALFVAGVLVATAVGLGVAVVGLGLASGRSTSPVPRSEASGPASSPTAASVQVATLAQTVAPAATSHFTFSTPTPLLSADITFTIVDEAGRSLAGATVGVLVGSDHGLTGADGLFRSRFEIPQTVPPTLNATVLVSKAGFESTEAEVRLAERAVTVRLRPLTQIAAGESVHLGIDDGDSEVLRCADLRDLRSFACRIIHVVPAVPGTLVLALANETGVGDLTLELARGTSWGWTTRQVLEVSRGEDVTVLVLRSSTGSHEPLIQFTLTTSMAP